ncbi:OmpP1/FadL family transporter [Pseudomonas sp. 18058]|uniref:OmpP1/FadL family transporter n=1 Tax=Pseudomonas sp. 18058 TaxID=2681406 RepID=UPI00135CE192|nr:OmpP1/FadL family transporter [Pseudomonas sp. 18058]
MRSTHSLLILALAGCSGQALAGGIQLYEAGQEGAGLANAGSAAQATDPSVMMNNPAGIAALKGTQVSLTGQALFGGIKFDRDGNNDFSGNEGGNPLPFLPGTSLFISHEVNDRASIGFGMYGNFGLSVKYDDDWAGRYFTQESTLIGISLQPTFAYKITDDLSMGIGPRLVYGYYYTKIAIDNNALLPGTPFQQDGNVQYKDTDTGTGINLGLRYQLDPRTTVGLAYTSKVKLEFKDSPSVHGIRNPLLNFAFSRANVDDLEIDMNIPQTATLSVAHQLNEQWTLLGSVDWQDWSDFADIGVSVDTAGGDVSRSVNRKYQDTWHLSLGAQNQLTPKLRWNMGVGYDSSAVKDKDRTVDNPMAEAWRLATGVSYKMTEDMDINLNYTLVWLGDMDVEQTKRNGQTLSGSYPNALLHIVGGGATWRF